MHESNREVSLIGLIYSEYREMPGLQLTLPQAMRLWSSDRDTCAHVLESLVDASFLRRDGGY